jgi:hypothetical protein
MTNTNITGGFRAGIAVASLCLGALIPQALQASSVGHAAFDDGGMPSKVSFDQKGGAAAAALNGRAKGSGGVDADEVFEKTDGAKGHEDWLAQGEKWENSRAHPDDDKWEKHPNGIPGPVDNPCVAKHCGKEPPSPVPVPAAAWLLGSGLLGLLGLARRRTR